MSARTLVPVGLGVAALAATLVTAAPAPAVPQVSGCAGNVCLSLTGYSTGSVIARANPRTTTFTGYFDLTGPGFTIQSPTQTWMAGSNSGIWTTIISHAPAGQYCLTGNPGQGTVCLTLN